MSSYEGELDEEALQALFAWIDQIPLSRKKKNINRDFSDGLLVAEILMHFFPRIVEIHNYASASSVSQKLNNWGTLNSLAEIINKFYRTEINLKFLSTKFRKILAKLNYTIPQDVMRKLAECTQGVVEVFLYGLWQKIEAYQAKLRKSTAGYTPENLPYYNARTDNKAQTNLEIENTPHSQPAQTTEYAVKNPIPLDQLKLSGLDSQTRLILEEKEQALLASQETVQILQVKIRRLEHLLHLKDLRLQDMEQRLTRFDSVSTLQSANQRH